jgi:hypothetical protein
MSSTRTLSKTTATRCRKRVSALVTALPDGRAVPMGKGHLSLELRGRRFGWFLDDHHGDGRIALNLKAPRGARERLVAYAPDTFHVPKYLGRHGWIGIWLDTPVPDWAEIEELLHGASELTRPGREANHRQRIINHTTS